MGQVNAAVADTRGLTVQECRTGADTVRVRVRDRVILALLAVAGIQSALYYADYWFAGGHRVNLLLFVLLSYATFRGVVRSVILWVYLQFVSIPRAVPGARCRSVDVLTTAMPGEPFEMFETTLGAVQRMSTPHTTYLLDGGNDERLRELCARLGVTHIDCRGVAGAKGGKINHCLAHHARGELVLVIDPDHIPRPDMLERVMPFFADPAVGFVQVVQAYYNYGRNVVAYAAAEQTFGFYGPFMMALNGIDQAVAIGANCVFRRSALDSIGGHAVHLAEDACTSMRLHAKGWKGRYLPFRGSQGLVPEDVSTFHKQQIKWSTGMFNLFLRELPGRWRELKWPGRFYYAFAGTYYLGGVVTLATIVLPAFMLFAQVYAVEMPFGGFIQHIVPYIAASMLIHWFTWRWYTDPVERKYPWRSMLLERGAWHVYSLAFVNALLGREVPWVPTAKSGSGAAVPWIWVPNAAAVAVSLAAIAWPLFAYHRIDSGTVLMMFFAALNVMTLAPSVVWALRPPRGRSGGGPIAQEVAA